MKCHICGCEYNPVVEEHTWKGCLSRVSDDGKATASQVELLMWIITKMAEDMMRDEYGKDRRNNELLKAIWDDRFDKALDMKKDEERDDS
jgi:hypothetical protein